MECPACRLLNPPEALACDCGYDFRTGQNRGAPGWPIDLTWSQNLAVYWSIAWPALVGSVILTNLVHGADVIQPAIPSLFYFGIQAVLIRRMVRKQYRFFRIYALNAEGKQIGKLSMRGTILVWLRTSWPQIAFMIAVSVILLPWSAPSLRTDTVQQVRSLLIYLRFLVVGPFAVHFALHAAYPAFRLQACGFRYR